MNHSNIYTKKQSRIIAWLLFLRAYSLFEASYDSIVFDCMITVVSPRLTLLEVVVTVRVTLQAVMSTERPIARAIKRVNRICLMYFFIVVVFLRVNNYQPLPTICRSFSRDCCCSQSERREHVIEVN